MSEYSLSRILKKALQSSKPGLSEKILRVVRPTITITISTNHSYWILNAIRLAERLAGLPLALATAGAFLQRSSFTFERYLQEYETRWNIDPRRSLRLQEYQDRTLYTTWGLLYTGLERDDPDAAKFLKLLVYFSNQNLWYELLRAGFTDCSPNWLREVVADDINFDGVMRTLTDYCFLEAHITLKLWSMHACVHDWTLEALNKDIDAQ